MPSSFSFRANLVQLVTGCRDSAKAGEKLKKWEEAASDAVRAEVARLRLRLRHPQQPLGLSEAYELEMWDKQTLVRGAVLSAAARDRHEALAILAEEVQAGAARELAERDRSAAAERAACRAAEEAEEAARSSGGLVRVVARTSIGKGGSDSRVVFLPPDLA